MKSVKAAPGRGTSAADERALRDLIERYGDRVAMADLAWLGGLLGKLRQGYSLTAEQVARVSAIRGELARTVDGR